MSNIEKIALVGGTHGNELTGVWLIRKWERYNKLIKRKTLETTPIMANHSAVRENRRYIERDLNRCFSNSTLEKEDNLLYEEKLAKEINNTLGPKGNPKCDFLLDMHTTTSNMGISIILNNANELNLNILSYLKSVYNQVKIIYSPLKDDGKFLTSLCKHGFSLEIGPISQGTLDQKIIEQTENIVYSTLDYIDTYNRKDIKLKDTDTEVYRYVRSVDYPRDEVGNMIGVIHSDINCKDYSKITNNTNIFNLIDGTTMQYEEFEDMYPIFINEAAYYEKGIAFDLTQKETIECSANEFGKEF